MLTIASQWSTLGLSGGRVMEGCFRRSSLDRGCTEVNCVCPPLKDLPGTIVPPPHFFGQTKHFLCTHTWCARTQVCSQHSSCSCSVSFPQLHVLTYNLRRCLLLGSRPTWQLSLYVNFKAYLWMTAKTFTFLVTQEQGKSLKIPLTLWLLDGGVWGGPPRSTLIKQWTWLKHVRLFLTHTDDPVLPLSGVDNISRSCIDTVDMVPSQSVFCVCVCCFYT